MSIKSSILGKSSNAGSAWCAIAMINDHGKVGNNFEWVDFADQHITWDVLKVYVTKKAGYLLSELDSIVAVIFTPHQSSLAINAKIYIIMILVGLVPNPIVK